MQNSLKSIPTRFRAYQLGQAGSSFSYCAGSNFTLIEAVITELNQSSLLDELKLCGKTTINVLHITSWDQDHCSAAGLEWILHNLAPSKIEYPGYEPHTENGKACLAAIKEYKAKWTKKGYSVDAVKVDPDYIFSLSKARELAYRDILYHPRQLQDSSNNNSTIKLFRSGSFNVLSLGDVEDHNIAAMLRRCKTLCREVDIMILAHHGADNGFTTKKFLETLRPHIAICSSNYDNQYDHPRQEIRNLLREQNIRLFTTKTGDVIIESMGSHKGKYRATNLISDSQKVSSTYDGTARKNHWLNMNADTLRNLYKPGFKGLKP